MSRKIDLEHLIIRVREMAIARLERFSRSPDLSFTQSFLFRNDRLAGVRIRSGLFRADWFYDESVIRFFRGDHQIDQLPVTPGNDQQAA